MKKTGSDGLINWTMCEAANVAVKHCIRTLARAGAPCAALRPLHRINMTRIESRPRKNGRFEYNFSLDLTEHVDDADVRSALDELGKRVVSLRVLGLYPSELVQAPRSSDSGCRTTGAGTPM